MTDAQLGSRSAQDTSEHQPAGLATDPWPTPVPDPGSPWEGHSGGSSTENDEPPQDPGEESEG